MQVQFFSEREREREKERESYLSVYPAEIYMFYFFSRNSENIQVIDTELIRARVVCEVALVWNVIQWILVITLTVYYVISVITLETQNTKPFPI